MTDPVLWASLGTLALATYLSALNLALLSVSRAALEQRLELDGRIDTVRWLFVRHHAAVLATALVRTAVRMTFFALVLAQLVGIETSNAALTWTDLVLGGLIALLLLWVFSTVLSSAIARYSGVALLASSLTIIRACTMLCAPIVRGMGFIDEAVRRLSGANLQQAQAESELLRSIEETQRRGGLDEAAAEMLENVVEFTGKDVVQIMTPRTDIEGIELTDDLCRIRAFIVEAGHSRIPVYEENLDRIVGILYVKDLIQYLGEGAKEFRLRPILRQPIMVPETKPVRELLTEFQKSEVHMAIVIDEYGGTSGLVTIEDVLEEIVGEIRDEHEPEDEEEPTLRTIDETHVEVDGRYHIDDLNEQVGLELPEDDDYDTVGGFVLAQLGRVPQAGESFESHNARFTALQATPRYVQRIGIELLAPVRANGQSSSGNFK